jgi:hypothetical protein
VQDDAVLILVLNPRGDFTVDDFFEDCFCHGSGTLTTKHTKYTKRVNLFHLSWASLFSWFHRNNSCRFEPRSVRAAASSRINPSASS